MPIRIEAVRKEYGDVVAVEDVSLTVSEGDFHCLIGPNGSGKTTMFRMLLGLTQPTDGTLSVPDVPIGCGFQEPNFYPSLTVRENIDVFASLAGGVTDEWRTTLLEELRLERALDRRADDLSGGFARKLDLTLSLLNRPEYLLLDEPLGALDDVSKERLLAFLDAYTDEGNAILVSTHHVDDFERYVDRVTIMHEGELVLDSDRSAIDLGPHDSVQEYYVERVLEREETAATPRGES
jgi:ABC-2 type transport system ATP-binding protein